MNNTRKYIIAIIIIICNIFGAIHFRNTPSNSLLTILNKQRIDKFSFAEKSIAIIGSSGYIGSTLLHQLQANKNWTIIGYDRIFPKQASYEISTAQLHNFQVVIYLGGLTGRLMCEQRPNDVEKENILDIYNLAKRMLSSQLLIFASTSAIAEGSGSKLVDEDYLVQSNLFDSYTNSMLRREKTLRSLSLKSKNVPQMIGLRFGTVIGLSNSQRIDLAHMALICQAFLNNRLRVTHPESNRAFLDMEDLVQAIIIIINHAENKYRSISYKL